MRKTNRIFFGFDVFDKIRCFVDKNRIKLLINQINSLQSNLSLPKNGLELERENLRITGLRIDSQSSLQKINKNENRLMKFMKHEKSVSQFLKYKSHSDGSNSFENQNNEIKHIKFDQKTISSHKICQTHMFFVKKTTNIHLKLLIIILKHMTNVQKQFKSTAEITNTT